MHFYFIDQFYQLDTGEDAQKHSLYNETLTHNQGNLYKQMTSIQLYPMATYSYS